MKSLGKASKVSKNNLEVFINTIIKFLILKDNQYFSTELVNIHFYYKLITDKELFDNEPVIHQPTDKSEIPTYKMFGYDLPTNMKFISWGKLIGTENNKLLLEYFKGGNSYLFEIEQFDSYNHIVIKDIDNDDKVLIEFKDFYVEGSTVNFIRKIKNIEYIFANERLLFKIENKEFKLLRKAKVVRKLYTNFITFDIETRTINNKMLAYCICFYDGINKKSFYLSEFNSSEDMVMSGIKLLFTKIKSLNNIYKYNGFTVYAHNFSRFDSIFLLKYLVKYVIENDYSINIIKRDSDLVNISIKSKIEGEDFELSFRDSYLLLQGSLKNLAKSFKVEDKGIFPYDFVNNPITSLNYTGDVPDFKYFNNLSIEEYQEYCSKFQIKNWDLRAETIKYCLQDCKVLYQILFKFAEEIHKDLKIPLKNTPTTSSLSLKSFLTNFLKPDMKIPVITGETFDFIQNSYTGGHVDVYKSHGYNLYFYDVISLYPFAMTNLLPCGNPKYFGRRKVIQFQYLKFLIIV